MKQSILRKAALTAALIAAATAVAGTHFTLAGNDTLRINSKRLGGIFQATMRAHLEERYDNWNLMLSYPAGLQALDASPGQGMTVYYLDSQGNEQSYDAKLAHSEDWTTFTSSTGGKTGYCDFFGNGTLVSYGSVKWETGDYEDMFTITFFADSDFDGGSITIDGHMSAQPDPRDSANGLALMFFRRIEVVVVDIEPGDVNGDGMVNITDVTLLINYLLNGIVRIDLDAADLNGDGQVNITDVTQLINRLTTE